MFSNSGLRVSGYGLDKGLGFGLAVRGLIWGFRDQGREFQVIDGTLGNLGLELKVHVSRYHVPRFDLVCLKGFSASVGEWSIYGQAVGSRDFRGFGWSSRVYWASGLPSMGVDAQHHLQTPPDAPYGIQNNGRELATLIPLT